MNIFCFFFKLSYGPSFMYNFQNDDNILHKKAVKLECLDKKLNKREQNHKFFASCCDTCPKFTPLINIRNRKIQYKTKFYRRVFLNEISSERKSIKVLKKELLTTKKGVISSTTYLKRIVLKVFINRSVMKKEKRLLNRHKKKLDNVFNEKNVTKKRSIKINLPPILINQICQPMQKIFGNKSIKLTFDVMKYIQKLELKIQYVDLRLTSSILKIHIY